MVQSLLQARERPVVLIDTVPPATPPLEYTRSCMGSASKLAKAALGERIRVVGHPLMQQRQHVGGHVDPHRFGMAAEHRIDRVHLSPRVP